MSPESEAPGGPVDGERLRAVARLLPAAVTVLVAWDGRAPHAMTANSFVPLSLDPPLVAVSIGNRSRIAGVIRPGTRVTASVLAAEQAHVALWFADPARPRGTVAAGPAEWRAVPGTPCPVLAEAVAFFAGTVQKIVPVGDHVLVVAETQGAGELAGELLPLVHWRGGFTHPETPEPARRRPARVQHLHRVEDVDELPTDLV